MDPRDSTPDEPLVSVIVINFDKKDILRRCLESALALDWAALEVIVVDNASADGSAEMVEAEFAGRVSVVRRSTNSVTAARNDGFRAASGAYYLSLDNDIVFPDPGVLRRGIELFDRYQDAGMLSFLIGTEENSREPLPEHWWYEAPIEEAKSRTFYTRYYSEGAVLIRPELIEATGGYDEDFFRCAENLDLTLLSAREGWRILFSPELHCAELEVRGFLDSRRTERNYLGLRNKLWVVWKHFPLGRGLAWAGLRIGMAAFRSVRYGWPDLFVKGVLHGVFAPRRIRRKRAPLGREVWELLDRLRDVEYVEVAPATPRKDAGPTPGAGGA